MDINLYARFFDEKRKFLKNYCNPLNAIQSCDKRRSCVATIFASRNIFYGKAVPKFLNFCKGRKKLITISLRIDTFMGDRKISQSFYFFEKTFAILRVTSTGDGDRMTPKRFEFFNII